MLEKKHFIFSNNKIYYNTDKTKHNTQPIESINHSINWELYIETLSTISLEKDKHFAICFYNPGSKTPPKYYNYIVRESEYITVNNKIFDCWILKVIYSEKQSCEFWIDKSTHTI